MSSQPPYRSPIWFRIGGSLALVIAFVIALLSFLNYANFRKTVQGLHEQRYVVLGKDVRQSVDAVLSLGLSPQQNARLPVYFGELRRAWPAIRFAGLIDNNAKPLIGAGTLASTGLSTWRDLIAAKQTDGIWHWRADHESAIGLTVLNNFGQKMGAVVIRYDDREAVAASNAIVGELVWRALLVILGSTVIALVGTWWLTRDLADELRTADAVLHGADLPPDNRLLVAETQAFVLAAKHTEQALESAAT